MPIMDGFEATRRIMETVPTPIVIVSGKHGRHGGRLHVPRDGGRRVGRGSPSAGHESRSIEAGSKELIRTVKLMSEIKVVRRIPRGARERVPRRRPPQQVPKAAVESKSIAIGASTGGPPVLQKILSGLPHVLACARAHRSAHCPGFVRGFAEWLADASGFPVHIASHGEVPLPGHAYIAPDGFHMGVANGPRIVLSDHPPENGLRPSVAYLFRSVAQILGPRRGGRAADRHGKRRRGGTEGHEREGRDNHCPG